MTVLIAGAGIGGLTLGLSLHQLGIPFKIFEAVRQIRPLGVGINVQPHAIRELFELGLEDALEKVGLRTKQVGYFSAQGGEIWREPRGEFAGYNWPQYSIHRGEMQMLLYRALVERAGKDVIRMGAAVTGSEETGEGVEIYLAERSTGKALGTETGRVFIAADGINSEARKALYPDEGGAHWGGIMMWRGVTRGPSFLGGRTMAMAGKKACKFVCYPIAEYDDGTCLINWIADRAMPEDYMWREQDWNREGKLDDFLPAFADWTFDWLNVPEIITKAESVLEYPMVDRNPLPRWSHGRMTLLGDAAHAMYPIGSNGASQAILDARVLARELRDRGQGEAALTKYDEIRRETVNKLVLANRGDGPDKVLDVVAERAPEGFDDISEVMSLAELESAAAGYKKLAGMDIEALNARGPLVPN
ncbi:flavin-dependent oxidoreductase [Lentibacter sp. XHP0401]|jgi:5-methylphenazine-1-carboxylate 1-monooxygenase|uniref:flavin-dependent oxidoreductase n=1 Tax=Lentibacter sp. XHP0401 TaxID=2984334 RepID=UPI0021E7302D|nr:flavin-dependent oxidoreductase [Lentibacter sp. XHP0401]MCV2892111.1 flavin-dependent oxidoreductase [Lentibacter sp. XHP0401]